MLSQPEREEIVQVLDRNYGSKIVLARRAGVSPREVTDWLQGLTSADVAKHAAVLYAELREKEQANPEREEVAKVFERNHGSKAKLSRRAGVSRSAVTNWMQGGASANISKHAAVLYAELREKERAVASAA